MTRKGDTVLTAALKRYGEKIRQYIQSCLNSKLKVKILVEDQRDPGSVASGAVYLEIEIQNPDGWGDDNLVQVQGTIGFDKVGKKGKKEDEAYLDGVIVGDWEGGSKAIGLNGCSVGEFLTHIFTLFAIKAGNESVLLDNAAGPRGEHIYKQVGFIKSKGDRVQYGEDNEMIFSLTGKKKNKDAGQLWRERYNKFRKKLKTKIKNSANCKTFWKCVPPPLEAPGPVHMLARGSKRRTRKKRGGDAERPPITLNKQQFISMVENNPDKVYKIIRNLRTEGMDDPDDPDYGFNVWYPGKIEYEGFDEDWGGDVFGFTMYDEDGDEIRWSDIYPALKTGPDTDALDYEWINIKDAGQPIKFVGGKRRKKRTRKKRGGGPSHLDEGVLELQLAHFWNDKWKYSSVMNRPPIKEFVNVMKRIAYNKANDSDYDKWKIWFHDQDIANDHIIIATNQMLKKQKEEEKLEMTDEEVAKLLSSEGGGRRKKKTRKMRGGVRCPPRELQIIDNKDEKLIPGERYLFIPSAMNNIAGGVGLGWIPTYQVPEHDEYFLNTCVSGTYIRKGTEQEPDMYVFLGKTLFDTPCFWGVTADAIWFPSDMSLGAQGMKAKPGAGGGRRRKKRTRKKRGGNECKDKSKEDCEKKPLSLICKWGKKKIPKKQVGRFIVDTYGPEHCYQFRDKKSWLTPALQARVPEYKDFIRGTTPEKKPSEFDKKGRKHKKRTRKKRGGINEEAAEEEEDYYIIQNNAENIRRFQEQVFSPDTNAEDAEGLNNLIRMMENTEDAGGFWIVEYSLTRDLDDNYHHYHLAWENDIPDINDNPDLENAIPFINDEQNGGGKRRKKKTRKKRGGNGNDPLPVGSRVRLISDANRGFITGMIGTILEVEQRDGHEGYLYKVAFNQPPGWDRVIGLTRILPANKFALVEGGEEGMDEWTSSDEDDDDSDDEAPLRPYRPNTAAIAAGGRKKKGGLLGPRELEEGRQYLYTGPEPHIMPQAEWHTPVRITVTYRGRNVPGLTPNQHYFDGERDIARDGHSLDIFSLNDGDIRQHIQPWTQNPGPSRVTNPSGVYARRARRESMCENCTIMGGRKKRGGYGPGITEEQARQMRRQWNRQRIHPTSSHGETEQKIRSELSASGPGDLVTNQPTIEETERSKALRKIKENNDKIRANMKKRKEEKPKKFTEAQLNQIKFRPTDLKKNQIGIVNPDGSLAVASKIKVPWHKRLGRNITRKFKEKLAQRKRKTRVAPMPRGGGRKTKRRRKKHKKTRRK